MKKILGLIALFVGVFFLCGGVNAKIQETSIKEAVEEEINYFGDKENIEDEHTFDAYQVYVSKMKNADLSDYSESDDKVNVYIFRGKSCWHCLDEISWLATQVKEYGKYFNIHTYEVWGNKDNNKLMSTVAKTLGETASGVPFTVIGKATYSGFSEKTGEEMLKQIKTQYESKDRYDIKNDINLEDGTVTKADDKKSSSAVMIILIGIVVVAGIAIVIYIGKSK